MPFIVMTSLTTQQRILVFQTYYKNSRSTKNIFRNTLKHKWCKLQMLREFWDTLYMINARTETVDQGQVALLGRFSLK